MMRILFYFAVSFVVLQLFSSIYAMRIEWGGGTTINVNGVGHHHSVLL
jgi:hypothetical protein